MNPGIHAATSAAAAAAARRRRQMLDDEEERMTRYNPEDLDGEWEFKIVRSLTPVFRKPEVLQRVLAEEAVSGWKLLEKLDDSRIRLKRPASAKRKDAMLPQGVEPYRSQIGSGASASAALMVGLVMLLAFGVLVLVLGSRSGPFGAEGGMIIFGAIVFITLMVIAIAAYRKGM